MKTYMSRKAWRSVKETMRTACEVLRRLGQCRLLQLRRALMVWTIAYTECQISVSHRRATPPEYL